MTRSAVQALLFAVAALHAARAPAQQIFPGDGSDEPGFVPPPAEPALPRPPPRTAASAETTIPFPPPPVAPMSRTEAKKPPSPPVLFTKLRTAHRLDWCATPNDVNNLLRRMKEMIDVSYATEVKTLAEVDPDAQRNPILYRSGHYHFSFTDEERATLRRFMLGGGMLLLNTGLGSRPFYDSACAELARIFPEVHLQRLSSDHPIFHACYDLDRVRYRPGVYRAGYKGDEPWFDGITIDCRTVAVISRWGLAVGWEGNENDDYQAYATEDACRLGINLFAYATAQRAWAQQSARQMQFVDADRGGADRVFAAQVVYDGEWRTRHAAVSVLLQAFNARTEIPVRFALREMRLTDAGLFDAPLLYLTGHEHFELTEAETGRLREYVLGGGFVFAEACCGRKGFDLAFRRLLARALPEYPLRAVPADSDLFRVPNDIASVGVTPALAAQLGRAAATPVLESVTVDGNHAVVYSPFGLAGGWEMSPSPYAHGYDQSGAIRIGQNVLMYAVTH